MNKRKLGKEICKRHGRTPGQVAIAWTLRLTGSSADELQLTRDEIFEVESPLKQSA